jgi:hypothetical protein
MLPDQGAACCPEQRKLSGQARRQSTDLGSFAPALLILAFMTCAVTLAGCACNPFQRGFQPFWYEGDAAASRMPARAHGPRRRPDFWFSDLWFCRPDAVLLVPQPAPDCEFKGADNKVVDPDEMARLKTEYERQCYRKAEKAARDRLSLLQASSACAIGAARHR